MTTAAQGAARVAAVNASVNAQGIAAAPSAGGSYVPPPVVAPVAPTTSTSVKTPASTPTAVISSGTAINNYNNTTVPFVNDASTAIGAQSTNNAIRASAPPVQTTTTPPPSTEADNVNNILEPGYMFVYDKQTGSRSQIPSSQALSSTQTMTDVSNAGAIDQVTTGTTTYKQYSDGTYAAFNDAGQYLGPANANTFAAAKGSNKATADLEAIRNGTYPLTAAQQAQLDNIKNAYQPLIDAATTESANIVGNTAGLQSLFGVQGTSVGVSALNDVIGKGAAKISSLNTELTDKVSAMKAAMQQDDINLVQQLKNAFDKTIAEKQKELDTLHSEAVSAEAKQAQNVATVNDFFAKKYPDTSSPILPTDTSAEMNAKLQSSPKYVQDTTIAKGLDSDATKFWADMATSGVSMASILPNLGIGAVAAQQKLQIMQSIAVNAKTLGLSAQDVANSIMDKKAKATTYGKLQTQGSLLAAQESKVESDFELVKQAGAKVGDQTLQSGITFLQNWINTGTLQTSGNAALNNYLGLLTTSLTNYARVVAGQTGSAATTAQMNTEIQGIINKGLTVSAVNSYIDNAAIPEMKNTVAGYDTTMKSIMGNMNVADGTLNSTEAVGGTGTTAGGSTSGGGTNDPLGIR